MSEKINIDDFYSVIKDKKKSTKAEIENALTLGYATFYRWLAKLQKNGFVTSTGRGQKMVICVTDKPYEKGELVGVVNNAAENRFLVLSFIQSEWVIGVDLIADLEINAATGFTVLNDLVKDEVIERKNGKGTKGKNTLLYRRIKRKKNQPAFSDVKKGLMKGVW